MAWRKKAAADVGKVRGSSAPKVTVRDDADAPEGVHGWMFVDRLPPAITGRRAADTAAATAESKGTDDAAAAAAAAAAADAIWAPAVRVVDCEAEARPGYETRKAHEYLDTPDTLAKKVKALANLVRRSDLCCAYTGAGISTASGIGDYASQTSKSLGAGASRPKLRSPFEAQPTLAHRVLTSMYHNGHLKYWIQQNHDGLPQKAGLPQEAINEIHGAWFDPSNPVVPMSGQLRTDLFEDLLEWEVKADLCLSMGTSMCGMNADRVATSCAERAQRGHGQGMVIVSLQQTQYDHMASLRIYATIDDVMKALAHELGIRVDKKWRSKHATARSGETFRVPYDPKTGVRVDSAVAAASKASKDEAGDDPEDPARSTRTSRSGSGGGAGGRASGTAGTMTLDLREGAKVRLTGGMYKGDLGHVIGRTPEGHWRFQFMHDIRRKQKKSASSGAKPAKSGKVPFVRIMGTWWVDAAVRGAVPIIPMVNV